MFLFDQGRSIAQVNLALNHVNRSTGMAFVTFLNVENVEWALEQINGKRIRKTLIKVYRSSEEQLDHYCDTNVAAQSLQSGPDASTVPNAMNQFLAMSNPFCMNSVPDLGEQRQPFSILSIKSVNVSI